MLSRRHIRVKVLQALYMYHSGISDANDLRVLKKATDKSISQLYDLYLYLLLFLEELGNYAQKYEEELKGRYLPNDKEIRLSRKLFTNPILQKLAESPAFNKVIEKNKIQWQGENDLLRKIFLDLKNQENYQDYVQLADSNPALNSEILSFILKQYSTHFSLFTQHLEEAFINWHDDRKIVMQMLTKTLQTLAVSGQNDDYLSPLSLNDDENYEYAQDLLVKCIEHDSELESIINPRIGKWEPHQIAVIDRIILKMAVCEFLYFPSIPAKVSINEYIELAKSYSTPQSKKFINGVLDTIQKELKKEGILIK
jgi:N utilization substance protein B